MIIQAPLFHPQSIQIVQPRIIQMNGSFQIDEMRFDV